LHAAFPCQCIPDMLCALLCIAVCRCSCCSASAAEAACSIVGAELLSAIRLPAWAELLPAPPTPGSAAAADLAGECQQPDSSSNLWWLSSGSSGSRQCCAFTNQQWLQALQRAGLVLGELQQQLECDCCGRPCEQQGPTAPPYYCAGCGVAVYCSISCRANDGRSHSRQCRLLQAVARPGGGDRDWGELTAAAVAAPAQLRTMLRPS
jgi:hypothetical protein